MNKFKRLVEEIKEMATYKKILKDSYGGVMYFKRKEDYSKDIEKKFIELEELNINIWFNTDGIFRGVWSFIRDGVRYNKRENFKQNDI